MTEHLGNFTASRVRVTTRGGSTVTVFGVIRIKITRKTDGLLAIEMQHGSSSLGEWIARHELRTTIDVHAWGRVLGLSEPKWVRMSSTFQLSGLGRTVIRGTAHQYPEFEFRSEVPTGDDGRYPSRWRWESGTGDDPSSVRVPHQRKGEG